MASVAGEAPDAKWRRWPKIPMESKEVSGKSGRWRRRFGIFFALVVVGLWIDWRPVRTPSSEVVESFRSSGPVLAGAARVPLALPSPAPIAGYPRQNRAPTTAGSESLFARSLALRVGERTVVLSSAELLLVPASLRMAVMSRLGDVVDELDALLLTATHTHSGPGGHWDLAVAERMGVGAFDPDIEAVLADRIAASIRESLARLSPARVSFGRIEASSFSLNRNGFGTTDPLLSALRVDRVDGSPIGRVVVYAAHPTISPRDASTFSGDWPGALMQALEEESENGEERARRGGGEDGPVALSMQGASGDVTWGKRAGEMTREQRVDRFGRAVASDARGALGAAGEGEAEATLSFARARVVLPAADAGGLVWAPFVRPVSNLFHRLLDAENTEVSWLRIGDARFAFLPGEPVAELGIAWRRYFDGATIVSLADDYVGYVELPARVEAKQGESKRSYFGPSLAPMLLEGLRTAHEAAEADAPLVDG